MGSAVGLKVASEATDAALMGPAFILHLNSLVQVRFNAISLSVYPKQSYQAEWEETCVRGFSVRYLLADPRVRLTAAVASGITRCFFGGHFV